MVEAWTFAPVPGFFQNVLSSFNHFVNFLIDSQFQPEILQEVLSDELPPKFKMADGFAARDLQY